MDVLVRAEEIPLCTDFARKTRAKVAVAFGLLATLSILAGCFVPFAMIGMISMALGMLNSMGVFGDGKLSQIIGMVSMVGSLVGMAGSIMCPGGGIGFQSGEGFYMGAERFTSIQGIANTSQLTPEQLQHAQLNDQGQVTSARINGQDVTYNAAGEPIKTVQSTGSTMTIREPNGTSTYIKNDSGQFIKTTPGAAPQVVPSDQLPSNVQQHFGIASPGVSTTPAQPVEVKPDPWATVEV